MKLILFICLSFCVNFCVKGQELWLDDLPIQTYSEGLRPVIAKQSYIKDTIRLQGQKFSRGLGAISPVVLAFVLEKKAIRFQAIVGVEDKGNKDIPLSFYVLGDGKVLFEKKDMKVGDAPVEVDVDVRGIQQLGLLTTDPVGGVGNKKTYANWANARLLLLENFTPGHIQNTGEKYILTPEPLKTPRINSPQLVGARPNHPFLYSIAATGDRPMRYTAQGLPSGLLLDPSTGIITGKINQAGIFQARLQAENKLGKSSIPLEIRIGEVIALTPPLGWNGWNSWEAHIDQEKVLASAEAMMTKKLNQHGWSYINIDDAWQGIRDPKTLALQPNEKFPDIRGMIAKIHAMGLKSGVYSTPYIASYGGYVGASSDFPQGGETHDMIKVNRQPFSRIAKYRFEIQDANQMADWGVDYLKYDWRIDVNSTQRMSEALRNSGRDIVFSISNNAPFEQVNDWVKWTNMYRTGPDIKDSWTSLYHTSFTLDKWSPYSGPGHWADPDMMILGDVSIGPVMHPTRLTPDEQYSHVSIFSLIAAPMLIGCPIERLDEFTLGLLSNDEVIAIHQDPLGKAGRLVQEKDGFQIWLRELSNGDFAIGIFNHDFYGRTPASYFRWGHESAREMKIELADLGLKGSWKIRDVWRQKDQGLNKSIKTKIPFHGVSFFRLSH
jgi:alpha-galactosidase